MWICERCDHIHEYVATMSKTWGTRHTHTHNRSLTLQTTNKVWSDQRFRNCLLFSLINRFDIRQRHVNVVTCRFFQLFFWMNQANKQMQCRRILCLTNEHLSFWIFPISHSCVPTLARFLFCFSHLARWVFRKQTLVPKKKSRATISFCKPDCDEILNNNYTTNESKKQIGNDITFTMFRQDVGVPFVPSLSERTHSRSPTCLRLGSRHDWSEKNTCTQVWSKRNKWQVPNDCVLTL